MSQRMSLNDVTYFQGRDLSANKTPHPRHSFNTLEPKTQWPPFCIRHFKLTFLFSNGCIRSNFTEDSNSQYASNGSANGSALNRRQAIIWSNDGLVDWRIYMPFEPDELSVTVTLHIYHGWTILIVIRVWYSYRKHYWFLVRVQKEDHLSGNLPRI